LNKGLPARIYSTGGRYGYKDQGQTPNTQLATFTFDDGTELVTEIRGRFTNTEEGVDGGVMFYGSKGYMASDPLVDGRFQVFLNGSKTAEPAPSADNGDDRAQDVHFANFLDAVRANAPSKLTAEINETYLSTMFCLLGNISYRLGRELRFDAASGRFAGDAEADAMLREPYRAPYTIPRI